MSEVHDGASLRAALLEIAGDFSFTWIAETRLLFDELEPRRFAALHHNPTALLSELTDDDLARALTPEYRERLARVQGRLARDRGEETWWRSRGGPSDLLVAYFSAEFGLDESLPIYSGGLGVLAGDYLKAASELGLPLVGIGLFYRRGYFRQRLDETDRQIELYPLTVTTRLPLELVPMAPVVELADDDGNLFPVQLAVWRARVGRTSLYLIDTHVEGNPEWAVTDTLYGGSPPPPASRPPRRCPRGTRSSTPRSCARPSAASWNAAASRGRTSSRSARWRRATTASGSRRSRSARRSTRTASRSSTAPSRA